jgi:site-specific DNA-methyltransferase (adenine-specific)
VDNEIDRVMELNRVLLADNMEVMKDIQDGYFELAIVDPPYFKGLAKFGFYGEKVSNTGIKRGDYQNIECWDDNVPGLAYFQELQRVSKHQIVWGINYYASYVSTVGRIIWDKVNDNSSFSKAEIASCSLHDSVQMFRYMWNGMLQGNMKNKEIRIHPTQKPVQLYRWLLKNYAKPGDKILDTHGGSCSSVIACLEMGFQYLAIEKDADYHAAAVKRIAQYQSQHKIQFA